MTPRRVPARAVLDEAAAHFATLGHENAGPLSEAQGFLPTIPPAMALPDGHAAWDALAARLPALHRDYAGARRARGAP